MSTLQRDPSLGVPTRALTDPSLSDDEDKLEDVLVTPDFDVQPSLLKEYYVHLDQRLGELQGLLGAGGAVLPSTYEKYMHGSMPAGASGNPLVTAKEYYEQLKQLRADSQVYYPVAPEVYRDLLWEDVDVADPSEYTFCRYTPITTEDARDFGSDGYSLRVQHRFSRHIKLLICVTLYNEDQETLGKTLLGICENLEVLYRQYGRDGNKHGLDWQEVAVAIIQDGISVCDSSVLAASTVQGFYSENMQQADAVGLPTSMHMFEYTARYKKHAGLDCYPPLQIMFASKTTNRGKLDSHCWFFDGFAYLLQPDFCVLFDAGTKPMPFALRNTYAHFKRNPWCGGLTGELRVERPYRNFLTSVQYMEWKISHVLNKPIESICGYLTVLPGAFSAFRWAAIEGEPLRRYFYGLYSQNDLSAFEANMYLAEDRVLCLEIVARKNSKYYLEYIKEAVAEADPVTGLAGLIKQRRRWLNGTFFAMIYTLSNWNRIWTESHHSFIRKCVLSLEFVYLIIMTFAGTWFGIGVFYTMLYQLFLALFNDSTLLKNIGSILSMIYLFLIIVQVIVNLKNKPEAVEKVHLFCAVFFMLYMVAFTGITIWYMTGYGLSEIFGSVARLGVILSLGSIVITCFLHGDVMAMAGAGLQYWFMQPVFWNILQVNAFCNTDDITWGTKNLDSKKEATEAKTLMKSGLAYSANQTKESKSFWKAMMKVHEKLTDIHQIKAHNVIKEAKLKAFATYLLISWLTTNIIFAQVVNIVSALEWQVCNQAPESVYGTIIQNKINSDLDAAQAVGRIVYTAQAIVENAAEKYPFGGLPNFPEAYPILLSGLSQTNASTGESVTVLAQSGEVFSSLPEALPTFDQWLNYSAGVNINKTIEGLASLKLPPPVNETGDSVACVTEYGRSYYLTIQFTFLAFLVGMQVVGSFIFIMMYYWRRITWRFRNRKGKQRIARAARDALALKKKNSDTFDLHVTSAGTSVTDRLGAGVDPAWLAQHSARTGGSGMEGDTDLGSEYSPRSSDASPGARSIQRHGSRRISL
ncbi:chitin [Micractinium conductrix]|uniref:chitin synthase n=1 Tax=Micractinium conductrix TaxID=554055 RepID=A0A2P6VJG9_9CHLO|nr:chitin [Micractinium conductrix]|eukprot:PSC74218.1 chitin [Micractinium conductrix]